MKKIVFSCIFLIVITLLSPAVCYAADELSYEFDGYTYDFWGVPQESPAAFTVSRVINEENMQGIHLSSVQDVDVSEDGRIFLADPLENRVNVFDESGTLLKSIKVLRNPDNTIALDEAGGQIVLSGPEGVYLHEKNQEIYIADTQAKRIVVLNEADYTLLRIIEEPSNMSGVTEFKPSKIVVDPADRIYVIVQSSYEGIIELFQDGSFSRYFGVNAPYMSILDYFWKSIASDTQKQKMGKTYAPSFNNIAMDQDGFVYAVTYDLSTQQMVFRLNAQGANVLREKGNTYVWGDIYYQNRADRSKFVDLAITDYGTYAVLDAKRGRIFLYNYDGELLNACCTIGNQIGDFKEPTGIAWLGDSLVVSDNTLRCAYILSPTEFGKLALRASEHYYNGEWDQALSYFQDITRINANYEIGYTGIGKNYLMKEDYEKAMYYFKLGNARSYYSKAYKGYRSEQIKKQFPLIAVVTVGLITLLFYSEVRYLKKKKVKGGSAQ